MDFFRIHQDWINLVTRGQMNKSIFIRGFGAMIFIFGLSSAVLCAQTSLVALNTLPDAPGFSPSSEAATASLSGTIIDPSGAVIPKASVTLEDAASHVKKVAVTNQDGVFTFSALQAGTYLLTIQAEGFATETQGGIVLQTDERLSLPDLDLRVASGSTVVKVNPQTEVEVARSQVKVEEKQRLLKVVPNFYVVYDCDPAPLTPKLKFALASRVLIDPYVLTVTGAVAGLYQATDTWNGYGQGAVGYGKRYAAEYGNIAISTFLGGGVFPVLFHQDPRFFYKGTGSTKSRIKYALLTAVRTKGDNGLWQPDYSGFLGLLTGAAITNTYLAPRDRAGISGIATEVYTGFVFTALNALGQEFIFRRFTSHHPQSDICE